MMNNYRNSIAKDAEKPSETIISSFSFINDGSYSKNSGRPVISITKQILEEETFDNYLEKRNRA